MKLFFIPFLVFFFFSPIANAYYAESSDYLHKVSAIFNILEGDLTSKTLSQARNYIQSLLTGFQAYQNQHIRDPADFRQDDKDLFQESYNEVIKAYNKAVRSIPSGQDGYNAPLIDYYYDKDQNNNSTDGDIDPEPTIDDDEDGDDNWSSWNNYQVKPPDQDANTKENIFQFQCLKALADSLPAPFCWAKKIYRPKRCPQDYPYRKSAACHKKDTIFSKFITFFNSKVQCEPGDNKVLGYCEAMDRCTRLGYVDCGIGACAMSKSACISEVASIVAQSLSGLVKLSAFIASMGASSAASGWVVVLEVFKDIKKYAGYALSAINTILSVTSIFLKKLDPTSIKAIQSKIVNSALSKVKRYLPFFKISKTDAEITAKLNYVLSNINDVRKNTESMSDSIVVKIKKAVSDKIADIKRCFQSMSSDIMKRQLKDVMCYKDYIMPIISLFDPTGISGIISAFMYPKCPAFATDWIIK